MKAAIHKGGDEMDKKVLIFFSLFAFLMIGGSFVLSLWIFPKIIANHRYIGFGLSGMIEPTPSQGVTREAMIFIIAQMTATIGIVVIVGNRLIKIIRRDRPLTIDGYLFKISRITGHSEYDIFCKAAEDWPVSATQIEQDFQRYMADQFTPYYVNDFVRKNKRHVDELHLPLFIFKQH